jgi:hypothetical protein
MTYLRPFSISRFVIASMCLTPLLWVTGCKQSKKANQESLTPFCLKLAKERYSERDLGRLESSFYTDKRARGQLKHSDLKLTSYREVDSSATLGTYELVFDFMKGKEPLTLHNTSETGGFSLKGPNHVTFRGVCEVKWSYFKKSAFQKSFEFKAIKASVSRPHL